MNKEVNTNTNDMVNHPSHYTTNLPFIIFKYADKYIKKTIECIDVIRNMPAWKGNVIKYTWRAGLKKDAAMEDIDKEIEDLEKAQWYLMDRVKQLRLEKLLENGNKPIERKDFISIPFGTDSELIEEIIRIPKGYVATIEDNKIHIKKKDTSATEAIKSNHTIDNNEMVESTFKVGDWVVRTNGKNFCNGNKFAQIQSIALYGEMCYLDTGKWLYPSELRLWTINDAEPGDVLVCPKYAGDVMPNIFIFKDIDINNDVLCYCSFLKIFFATEGYIASADPINTDFYPANKEQYDLLFQKMKESGYKWNTDKKELKTLN